MLKFGFSSFQDQYMLKIGESAKYYSFYHQLGCFTHLQHLVNDKIWVISWGVLKKVVEKHRLSF